MDISNLSDVGMGVVYEQFRLNLFFERLVKKYEIKNVLEAPVYGMAGFTGINSMHFPRLGVEVTLVDTDRERFELIKQAWAMAGRNAKFLCLDAVENLPFGDSEFDLVYNFAALWHLKNPEKILGEMIRVSGKLVLVCIPNPWNPLFQVRKFLGNHPPSVGWANLGRIEKVLNEAGFETIEKGFIDVPPWPDTEVSIKNFLGGFGVSKGKSWRWSMLDYYCGKCPSIKEKVERYSFIENSRLPAFMKAPWAHHQYILCRK